MYYQNQKNPKVLILAIAFLFTFSLKAQNSRKVAKLEKRIQKVMDLANCAGMAVAVVEKDKIIYSKGFGFKDYENKKKVDTETLFAIGSCTKAFTGALLGQLQEQEKLDLDASPREYLPKLKFYNLQMNSSITIRDMLSHRTGLPRHDISWYMFPSNSPDSLLARIQYHEPTLTVRQGFQYNNFMYLAAGSLGAKITGKSWEENIRENIFKPLKMSKSNLHINELLKEDNIAKGYGYTSKKGIFAQDYYRIRGMAPAGSINSNVLEMANWTMAWINKGKFQGNQIIPEEYRREAISSQMISKSSLPSAKRANYNFGNYGFGWFLSSYNSHVRVEHGGNINGFSANVCFFPNDSIGIIVLVNQNGSAVPSIVRNIIADKMLGLKSVEWEEGLIKAQESKKEKKEDENVDEGSSIRVKNTKPSHKIEEYAGLFSHPGYGKIRILVKEDSLFAKLPDETWYLNHFHYDIFEPIEKGEEVDSNSSGGGFMFNFSSNTVGEIDGIRISVEAGLDPLLFKRQIEEVEIEANELEKYTGEYDLGGASAKVYIKEEGLKLFVPGQPEYSLKATGDDKFVLDGLEGYSVQFDVKDGEVKALTFMQPNGNFRVPKK
tara:strand:+ start:112256 stop:114073 length:1818 start_codon:yes stop_codon:yes gene_type:complete